MSESKIELQIPPEIVERARQIANEKDQSIETVLLDGLTLLFGRLPDTSLTVDELAEYRDEQLWAIVHQRLAWIQDTRLRELTDKGKHGQLSDIEKEELQQLLDLVDHQMLLRSEALVLLKQREHEVQIKSI